MKRILLLVLLLSMVAIASNATFVYPVFNADLPTDVMISGCDDNPCIFRKGEVASIDVYLAVPGYMDHVNCIEISWTIVFLGAWIDMPLDIDRCGEFALYGSLPVSGGEYINLGIELIMFDILPSMSVTNEVYIDLFKKEREPSNWQHSEFAFSFDSLIS